MENVSGNDFVLSKTTEKTTTWTDSVEKYSNYQKKGTIGLTKHELEIRGDNYIDKAQAEATIIDGSNNTASTDKVTISAYTRGTLSDNVKVSTASGSPMMVRFTNNLNGIDADNLDRPFSTDLTFTATDYANRNFNALPNTRNNVNEEGIYSEVTINAQGKDLWIQTSGQRDDGINLHWDGMSNSTLGIAGVSVATRQSALRAIDSIKGAINKVSAERSQFGAYQNRLEHTYNNDLNISENTQSAESRIRDTDMTEEMMENARLNIIEQANQTILAQANQQRQGILSLLQ
ncbi:MAG: hypothetical protein K6E98_04250 [Lachnospiraceae bacterium]|nr:hypothetical protein [Lachnospiraceae bacterium]